MSSSGGTMSMLVLPVEPRSRESPTCTPFSNFSLTTHEQQLQALLHFLIDHLKLFLIGCVPIADRRKGAAFKTPSSKSPEAVCYAMSLVRRRHRGLRLL